MPNGDLTWKEVLIVAAIWGWHLVFVLPTVIAASLMARCFFLPNCLRRSCRSYVNEHREFE